MAEIKNAFGVGGAYLPKEGGGTPSLYTILKEIAEDLAAGKAATIASADAAAAAGDPPTKAEFDVVVTLVNEIKAALNAVQSTSLKTTVES